MDAYDTLLRLSREHMSALQNTAYPCTTPAEPCTSNAANCCQQADTHNDQFLRSCLLRILTINRIVSEDAGQAAVSTGEMRCPECETGILCYLVDHGVATAIECSTTGCLRWDIRK